MFGRLFSFLLCFSNLFHALSHPEIDQAARFSVAGYEGPRPAHALLQHFHHVDATATSLPDRCARETQRKCQESVCHISVGLGELCLGVWVIEIGTQEHFLRCHLIEITDAIADFELFSFVFLEPLGHVTSNDVILQLDVHAECFAGEKREEGFAKGFVIRSMLECHVILAEDVLGRRMQDHQHLRGVVDCHELTGFFSVSDKNDELAKEGVPRETFF